MPYSLPRTICTRQPFSVGPRKKGQNYFFKDEKITFYAPPALWHLCRLRNG